VRTGGARAALAGLALALALGCARTEQNYVDEDQPRYEFRHGTAPAPRGTVRVVSFNIAYAIRIREAVRGLRDHAELRDLDVLLLQEMDAAGVETIANELGLNAVYYPSSRSPRTHRDLGTAVLSPWPIEASHKVRLPHLSRVTGHSRAAAAADVRIGGRLVRVYSLHIGTPFNLSPRQRRDQVDAVIADTRGYQGPVIAGGDFNGKGIAERMLPHGFLWPTRDVGRTTRFFAFDHILARGLRPAGAPFAGVVREVDEASDHRPVWAAFATR
jgi:endonuclease/exonuclease/phosphatase family metal-dependent hydrolase